MEKKNTKKKIQKKFIIFGFILLLVLLIIVITFLYLTKQDKTYIAKQKLDYIYSDDFNDEVYPDDFPKVVREYNGTLTAKTIGKSIDYVVKEAIPLYKETTKNMTNDELKKYYSENKEVIELTFGNQTEEEFVNFINLLKILKEDTLELENYKFNVDEMYKKSLVILVELNVKYNNCDEITMEVRIGSGKENDYSAIKYYAK